MNISIKSIHKSFLQFKENYKSFLDEEKFNKLIPYLENGRSKEDLIDAYALYLALKEVCDTNNLKAITVKCFEILSICNTTACLALSLLNDEGVISGCEGDMTSLITMMVVEQCYNKKSFMVNPSSIDKDSYTIDFAHCTIPLSLIKTFSLPTHFESNIGIAIRGEMELGKYSIVKIGGDKLTKHFSYQGTIIANTKILQRCRTQVRFQFDSKSDFIEFINNKLGNHVIIVQGDIML